MSAASCIELENIVKEYPGCRANDGIDLTVKAGEIHALFGENGAGKSTLMKVIYGVVQPDEGRMLWNGHPLKVDSPAEASVPIAAALGGWEAALGVWGVPALAATLLWLPWFRARDQTVSPSERLGLPWRDPKAWRITVFFAVSSCVYFSAITWVAPLYNELGYSPQSAGVLLSVLTGTHILGSLIISPLAQRRRDRRPWLVLNMVMVGGGALGLALIPTLGSWLWVILMGVGLGGMFPLILTLPLDNTQGSYSAGRLNAMMFGVGMTIAGGSPYAAGWLRDLSQGYTVPFLTLTVLVIVMALIAAGFRPPTSTNQVS